MRKRTGAVAALVAGALAIATAATTAGAATSARQAVSCKSAKIAFIAPLTGDAAFIGTEQGGWARFAVKQWNKKYGTHYGLDLYDSQLDPALASTDAQKVVSDANVLAMIGPSTSGAVVAAGPITGPAHLAMISSSATRVSLTDGSIPNFFRVVGNDGVQGPTDAAFMVKTLKAKKVYIIDDQETYSTGLADQAGAALKAAGVTVIRDSVAQTVTDFSSIVTKIPADTNVVFIPWQQPPRAQTFAQQMREQGKKAIIFGSDGTNAPSQFTAAGSYVSNFAPDIRSNARLSGLSAAYTAFTGNDTWGSFGPPTYGAVQVALTAIQAACKAGKGSTTRAAVLAGVPKVKISSTILGKNDGWILGGTFSFAKSGDPKGAKFYIFKVVGANNYQTVG